MNAMKHSPPWEANRSLASQEFPRVLQTPKVYYYTHNTSQNVVWCCTMEVSRYGSSVRDYDINVKLWKLYS